jgi:uncharacterized protein YndB with AHSA1/START domain
VSAATPSGASGAAAETGAAEAVAPVATPRRSSGFLFLLGALLVLAIGVVVILVVFPTEHVSSRTATLDATPATVYSLLSNVEQYAAWRTGIERVEVLEDDGAGLRFREYREGGAITYRVEIAELNSQLRIQIDDDAVPFEGSWTFDLTETNVGTDLTILEAGHAYGEVFRLASMIGFAIPGTKEEFLDDLRSALRRAPERP